MMKYAFIGIGLLSGVASFSSGMKLSDAGASATASTVNVEKLFAEEAAKANRKKGAVTGHSTFVEAEARGRNLFYQYELNLNPRNINTAAAKDQFYQQAIPMLCKGNNPLRKAIDQGASIEYAYRTTNTKQFLFEVRLTSASCRA